MSPECIIFYLAFYYVAIYDDIRVSFVVLHLESLYGDLLLGYYIYLRTTEW
jgi:hypothetical protein